MKYTFFMEMKSELMEITITILKIKTDSIMFLHFNNAGGNAALQLVLRRKG
jgi:hypothetical protein